VREIVHAVLVTRRFHRRFEIGERRLEDDAVVVVVDRNGGARVDDADRLDPLLRVHGQQYAGDTRAAMSNSG